MPDAPAATPVLSSTSTSSPSAARCQAVDSPWTPAPTTSVRTEPGSWFDMRLLLGVAVSATPIALSAEEYRPLRPNSRTGRGLPPEATGQGLPVLAQHRQQLLAARGREASHRSLHAEDRG